jgi:hypothetical protein
MTNGPVPHLRRNNQNWSGVFFTLEKQSLNNGHVYGLPLELVNGK